MPLLKELVEYEEPLEVPTKYEGVYISEFKRFSEDIEDSVLRKMRGAAEHLKTSSTFPVRSFEGSLEKPYRGVKFRMGDRKELFGTRRRLEPESNMEGLMNLHNLFSRAVHSDNEWRVMKLNTFSPFNEISIPTATAKFQVIWNEDVKDYLEEDTEMDAVLKETVDDIVRYGERAEGLMGVQIRFLRDPDDPTKAIMLEIQHDSSVSKSELKEHKKRMRSQLTENAKRLTSRREEYIRIRAALNVITRGV
ncbi:MAG: hypothetical protein GF309_16820 [Candidatus Lokiarchaeota archaeon]|nr:hypothetical protein [Candidatus Lokiarchaeota archaeon]